MCRKATLLCSWAAVFEVKLLLHAMQEQLTVHELANMQPGDANTA